MYPRFPRLAFVLAALVTAGGFASLTLRAEEKTKTPERPPLTIKADPKAIKQRIESLINRDFLERCVVDSKVYKYLA
jgi:hypothetical protein